MKIMKTDEAVIVRFLPEEAKLVGQLLVEVAESCDLSTAQVGHVTSIGAGLDAAGVTAEYKRDHVPHDMGDVRQGWTSEVVVPA